MDARAVPAPLTRESLKRAAGIIGAALCVLSLVLLVRRGLAIGTALGDEILRIRPAVFAAALGIYTAGALLLGAAWAILVRQVSSARPRIVPLVVGHLGAQLAKYLPGNVFHFAYRHVAATREGVGHRALAGALGLESLLLIAAAAILALGVVADPRITAIAPWAHGLVWAAPVLVVLAWSAVGLLGRRAELPQLAPVRTAPSFAAVLAIDLVFFALAAAAARLLCNQPAALPYGAWCGWLSLAWLLGYVVPGAPAGLGLREAVLTLGLTPVIGSAAAVALSLAYRLLTLMSDAVLAAIGLALLRRALTTPGRDDSQ